MSTMWQPVIRFLVMNGSNTSCRHTRLRNSLRRRGSTTRLEHHEGRGRALSQDIHVEETYATVQRFRVDHILDRELCVHRLHLPTAFKRFFQSFFPWSVNTIGSNITWLIQEAHQPLLCKLIKKALPADLFVAWLSVTHKRHVLAQTSQKLLVCDRSQFSLQFCVLLKDTSTADSINNVQRDVTSLAQNLRLWLPPCW